LDKQKTITGVILSRKDIGEADRLLTVFSKNEGKIKIIARGTRRLKSKNASHIEPFTVGKYTIVPGKTFYVLTGAESVLINEGITKDLDKYKMASYASEILGIVGMENQPMIKSYTNYVDLLGGISKGTATGIDLRIFEYIILEELGYMGNYQTCLFCGKTLTESEDYWGNYEGVSCGCKQSGTKINKNTLKILRMLARNDFDKIRAVKGIEDYNKQLKSIIGEYLYTILPKIPKSGDL
jgi:DNA repair protein RecO (recombination protein O)